MSSKRLAIIPARGGSKRLPRKNIMPFYGKPMMAYALTAIIESGLFAKVHVSTDDPEISAVATALGITPDFERRASLADDFTGVLDVARYVLREYLDRGEKYDSFALVLPCTPLLKPNDLLEAYRIFEQENSSIPVIAVTAFESPFQRGFWKDDSGKLSPIDPASRPKRSQDLPKAYYDTGMFMIQRSQTLLESTASVSPQFLGYEMPRIRAIDIDSQEDLMIAQALFKLES